MIENVFAPGEGSKTQKLFSLDQETKRETANPPTYSLSLSYGYTLTAADLKRFATYRKSVIIAVENVRKFAYSFTCSPSGTFYFYGSTLVNRAAAGEEETKTMANSFLPSKDAPIFPHFGRRKQEIERAREADQKFVIFFNRFLACACNFVS